MDLISRALVECRGHLGPASFRNVAFSDVDVIWEEKPVGAWAIKAQVFIANEGSKSEYLAHATAKWRSGARVLEVSVLHPSEWHSDLVDLQLTEIVQDRNADPAYVSKIEFVRLQGRIELVQTTVALKISDNDLSKIASRIRTSIPRFFVEAYADYLMVAGFMSRITPVYVIRH